MGRDEKCGSLRQTVLQAEEERVKGSQVGQSPPLREKEERGGTKESKGKGGNGKMKPKRRLAVRVRSPSESR